MNKETQLAPIMIPGAVFAPLSLTLAADATEQTLDFVGQMLGNVTKASRWWIGDYVLLLRDKRRYYDREAIAERYGLDGVSVKQAAAAAEFYPIEHRRPGLTWTHHFNAMAAAVHIVDDDERLAAALKILDKAEAGSWTTSRVTEEVRSTLATKPVRHVEPAPVSAQPRVGLSEDVELKTEQPGMKSELAAKGDSVVTAGVDQQAGKVEMSIVVPASEEATVVDVPMMSDPGPIRLPFSDLIEAVGPCERAARALLLDAWEPDAATAADLKSRMRYIIDLVDMLRERDEAIDVEAKAT